jgi:malate dehydrogenase (oxaloacetate-decarboxylating)
MSEETSAPAAAISSQYAITLRIDSPRAAGRIARIAATIGDQGGVIGAIDLVQIRGNRSVRDYTVECSSTDHARQVIEAVRAMDDLTLESVSDDTFLMHLGGKLEVHSKVPLKTRADLSMAYTPGVARVCKAIEHEPKISHNLTIRRNCVAVISDGSAVLGLGNIGARAAMPVMEGKAILFKEFAGVDAFPLCLDTQDVEEIVTIGVAVAPTFGGINLEDISAPRCFEVERRIQERVDIPVFHDDQHGTAVVVLAATLNALRITGKRPQDMKLVVSGAGASGWACTRALKDLGLGHIVVCDRQGVLHRGRDVGDNPAKQWFVEHTNPDNLTGGLQDAIRGADMFMGLSSPGLLHREDVKTMARDPIVFAMANPTPEIMPEEAEGVVRVMATGRSDYPNQINNVLAFPGIFRGALDARARCINDEMKGAAAQAIAEVVTDRELSPDYIVPSVFNRTVVTEVGHAVARAARASKVARRIPKGIDIYR